MVRADDFVSTGIQNKIEQEIEKVSAYLSDKFQNKVDGARELIDGVVYQYNAQTKQVERISPVDQIIDFFYEFGETVFVQKKGFRFNLFVGDLIRGKSLGLCLQSGSDTISSVRFFLLLPHK